MEKLVKLIKSPRGRELVRFAIIGAATTAVNFAVTWLARRFIPDADIAIAGLQLPWSGANLIGIVTSILFAYLPNRIFVFKSSAKGFKAVGTEFSAFLASRAFTAVIEALGVPLLKMVIGFWPAKIAVNVAVIIINYTLSIFAIFKRRSRQ